MEEENMRTYFGFGLHDPDTVELLQATQVPEKCIQGTPWYQLLSNPLYSSSFAYIGAFIREREKLIEDGYPDCETEEEIRWRCEQSDLIMILLNLAYIPDQVILDDNFDFEPGW
jgi:hypothetical protein